MTVLVIKVPFFHDVVTGKENWELRVQCLRANSSGESWTKHEQTLMRSSKVSKWSSGQFLICQKLTWLENGPDSSSIN